MRESYGCNPRRLRFHLTSASLNTTQKMTKYKNISSFKFNMIADLPQELQDVIFRKLHVKDRAKLLMALPKSAILFRKTHQCKYREKKLGILSNAIEKRHLDTSKMPIAIKEFITKECASDDPTIQGLVIPVSINSDIQTDAKLRERLYRATPEQFDEITRNSPSYTDYVMNNPMLFLSGAAILYGNEALFAHLLNTLPITKERIANNLCICGTTDYRMITYCFKYQIPFTKEQLEKLAKKAIELLHIESYQEILKHL
jgi:hypothetical protein